MGMVQDVVISYFRPPLPHEDSCAAGHREAATPRIPSPHPRLPEMTLFGLFVCMHPKFPVDI